MPSVSCLMNEGLDVVDGYAEQDILIFMAVNLQLAAPNGNASKIAVQLCQLHLSLNVSLGNDAFVFVGSLCLEESLLKAGSNMVSAQGSVRVSPHLASNFHETKACIGFFSSLLQNEPIEKVAIGEHLRHESGGVSDAHWLALTLAGVRIYAVLPPLGDKAHIIDGTQSRVEDEPPLLQNASSPGKERTLRYSVFYLEQIYRRAGRYLACLPDNQKQLRRAVHDAVHLRVVASESESQDPAAGLLEPD